jgi:hypothetical protein
MAREWGQGNKDREQIPGTGLARVLVAWRYREGRTWEDCKVQIGNCRLHNGQNDDVLRFSISRAPVYGRSVKHSVRCHSFIIRHSVFDILRFSSALTDCGADRPIP